MCVCAITITYTVVLLVIKVLHYIHTCYEHVCLCVCVFLTRSVKTEHNHTSINLLCKTLNVYTGWITCVIFWMPLWRLIIKTITSSYTPVEIFLLCCSEIYKPCKFTDYIWHDHLKKKLWQIECHSPNWIKFCRQSFFYYTVNKCP